MRYFRKIAQGIDTLPILLELDRAHHLWNAEAGRKTFSGTPHAAMTDIWVRFRSKHEIVGAVSHKEEHRNVYWPAWRELPSLRPLVSALKTRVDAVELGTILITRLPPGEAILPHDDKGSWTAEFYNCKVHVTLQGQSLSRCRDETVIMVAGDAWTFDNLLDHDVRNNGEIDRIVCIVAMRVET